MLNTVKRYIEELPDIPFSQYYQTYICDVQDMNILAEINSVNTKDMVSLHKILERLKYELPKQ